MSHDAGSSSTQPPADPVEAASKVPCYGPVPASWTTLLGRQSVTTPAKVAFTVDAVAGAVAFGQYESVAGSGVGALDLSTGKLTKISTYAGAIGGVGAMAVESPWVVWEQLDSQTLLKDWSIHAWNQSTGATLEVANSRLPDGSLVDGQQPLPVLRHGRVAWSQPVPSGTPGIVKAEIRVTDLDTRATTTVTSGRVSSPVYAGVYLLWATIEGNSGFGFGAADAETSQPVALPAQLRKPESVGQLAGSPDYLAWSGQDSTNLVVWRIGTTRYDRFSAKDGVHFFQFMHLSDHYLVWFGGGTSSVLDLNTGNGFDIPGTVSGSADSIVVTEPVSAPSTKGELVASRVSRIEIRSAPAITSCG